MSGAKRRALEGIQVIAIEQAVAAPFATCRLADAGATVVKIERPEGDFARGYDSVANGLSSYFVWLNRGKQSLIIDLGRDADRARLNRMLANADVFVQNLRPGVGARWGFDTRELCKRHPRLICCSISGFDDDGPMANRKAYDLLIQAESGLASITGAPGEPSRVGISVVDIATGSTAHAAILEALIGRSVSGQGADIHISMFDVMADWLTVPLLHHEAGKSPKRLGFAHPSIAPYGAFVTGDDRSVLIAVQSDREWAKLCDMVLNRPDLIEDRRYSTNIARTEHRGETDRMVGDAIARFSFDQLTVALNTADIAYAEINDMAGLAVHPELKRITVHTPSGPISYPAPATAGKGRGAAFGRVPALGENDLPPPGDPLVEND